MCCPAIFKGHIYRLLPRRSAMFIQDPFEAENGTATGRPPRRKRQRRKLGRKHRTLQESLARAPRPPEDEDWEKEIKASSPIEDWDKETYSNVYDPEDVICSGMLQTSLTSEPRGVGHTHYSPAVHHVSPVKWVQHVHHIVVDQFIDADE